MIVSTLQQLRELAASHGYVLLERGELEQLQARIKRLEAANVDARRLLKKACERGDG